MNQFIAIHYNGQTPAFTYTNTLEDARRHLSSLITKHQVSPSDAMAIVRAADDHILYFKLDNNTVSDLSSARPAQPGFLTQLSRFASSCTLWFRHSFATHEK